MFSCQDDGSPEGHQVAQKGEFQYKVFEIRDYRRPFPRIRYNLPSEMIAYGRFWMAIDRGNGLGYAGMNGRAVFSIRFLGSAV
jgi:hypothetical protein